MTTAAVGPASRRRLRVFLGAFGQPGHAFPMMALGRELVRRGHHVAYETWERWQPDVEREGMQFLAAPEFPVFPTLERPLKPYEAVARAVAATRPALAAAAPDVVVHDILTLAPALAGELEGVPVATLVPHLYPVGRPGAPPFAFGARLPRTRIGREAWRVLDPLVARGLRQGRAELNQTRTRLGLPPTDRLHGGISDRLCLVGTFPQLEYPRQWPASVHVVGPLQWEPEFGSVGGPGGEEPLVLVAPSTAQDPSHRLLRSAVAGLRGGPVRVLAATNRRHVCAPVRTSGNVKLVEWVSYSQEMPRCDVVLCHAGHGTLARALSCGCRVVAVPHSGDMAENAARVDWAGAGFRLPWRLLSPGSIRLAVERALLDQDIGRRVAELAAWAAPGPGPPRAAELLERLVAGTSQS